MYKSIRQAAAQYSCDSTCMTIWAGNDIIMAAPPRTKFIGTSSRPCESLHLLPCAIEYEGPAPVKDYFVSEPSSQNPAVQKLHFRGRELLGSQIELPEGFTGVIGTQSGNTIQLSHNFNTFTSWNREVTPSHRDPTSRWMQWTQIASAVSLPTPFPSHLTNRQIHKPTKPQTHPNPEDPVHEPPKDQSC